MAQARGCQVYVVGHDHADDNPVFINEIWDSKEAHGGSLNLNGVRELIMKAMPLLDGQPTKGQEIEIVGGTMV